uniref:Uncharacterized protein n=1 Tax=Cannabis sativa TaxID=3483 RepID=A0A803P8G4_CANSA
MVNTKVTSLVSIITFVFIFFVELSESQKLAPALYVFGDSNVDVGNNNKLDISAKTNYLPYGIDFPGATPGRPTNGYNIADFFASETNTLAPALYVFGDSTVDVGNNNNFDTISKANFSPYGIDFDDGATGRPTNGYNMADVIALSLGLNIPPAIRSVDFKSYDCDHGFNYASSSSGILPDTGTNMKGVMSLGEQTDMFNKTVHEFLRPRMKNPTDLKNHLSKSIFFLVTGSNDFTINFLMSKNRTNSDRFNFSKHLVQKYATQLQKLYYLGARKFVVFEVEAMGCSPSAVLKAFPNNPNKCVDDLNNLAKNYNTLLNQILQQLVSNFKGAAVIVGKNYDFTYQMAQNPARFGKLILD